MCEWWVVVEGKQQVGTDSPECVAVGVAGGQSGWALKKSAPAGAHQGHLLPSVAAAAIERVCPSPSLGPWPELTAAGGAEEPAGVAWGSAAGTSGSSPAPAACGGVWGSGYGQGTASSAAAGGGSAGESCWLGLTGEAGRGKGLHQGRQVPKALPGPHRPLVLSGGVDCLQEAVGVWPSETAGRGGNKVNELVIINAPNKTAQVTAQTGGGGAG